MSRINVYTVINSEIDIPRGIITFFMGSSCPPGWVEKEEFQGRLPIGAGGTLGATLGDSFDRPIMTHDHEIGEHSHDYDSTTTGVSYNGLCQVAAGGESNAACGHTHSIFAGISSISTGSQTLSESNDLKNIYGGVFCEKI